MKHWKLIAFVLSLFGLSVMAQTNQPPVTQTTPATSGTSLLLLVIPLVVPIIVAVGKWLIPKLPGWTLPIIAPALGALLDYLSTLATGAQTNLVYGAILGGAGVGLREIIDQLRKASVTKP